MIYVRLFRGRTDPNQDIDDCGLDGPTLGPYEFVHTTYALNLKLGRNGTCNELFCYEDMVYYGGVYYGDWTAFGLEILKSGEYQLIAFDQEKANLPT